MTSLYRLPRHARIGLCKVLGVEDFTIVKEVPYPVDSTDREILRHLRDDGRLSARHLGSLVHLSAPAAATRVRRLEDSGIIAHYTIQTQLAPVQGLSTFVDVLMKSSEHHAAFAAFVGESPEVRTCYRTTGNACYLLRVECPDQASLGQFLDRLLQYANYRTLTVISTLIERDGEFD